MIIMVLMTGLKIRYTPVDPSAVAAAGTAGGELPEQLAEEQSIRRDVLKLAGEIDGIQRETLVRERERDALAVAVRRIEHEVEEMRHTAQTESPEDAALTGRLLDARGRLDDVRAAAARGRDGPARNGPDRELPVAGADGGGDAPKPDGRGRELHFQLHGGRIAYIPLTELLARFKADAEARCTSWPTSRR